MNTYKSSIDQNKIYKQQEKLRKETEKKHQQLMKKIKQLQAKRAKRLEEMKKDLDCKYQKELERYEKKQKISLEKLKRKIEWKKPLKKHLPKDNLKQLKNKLYELVQKYARLRDSDKQWWWKCISCWKRVRWDKADGWHYISRSNLSTAFDPMNIHLQCKYCNWILHWNYIEYRKNLIKKIGLEEVERLEYLKHKTHKRTKEELEEKIEYYTELVWQYQYDKEKI